MALSEAERERIRAAARRVAAEAPPLSPAQIDKLKILLGPHFQPLPKHGLILEGDHRSAPGRS